MAEFVVPLRKGIKEIKDSLTKQLPCKGYKGYKGYKEKAFSQEVRLLACS